MAKKLPVVSLQELYKRCPSNQVKQFERFRDKTAEYNLRKHKYPEFLPKIDWNYYRHNVRDDFVKMVDEFEVKYKELNSMFAKRVEMDTSQYFEEVEKVRCEVQSEYDQFICESEERIEAYEGEIARIRALKPFEEMTCEEFCLLCPEKAGNFPCYGKPSFWPHDEEEQRPGPAEMPKEHIDKGGQDVAGHGGDSHNEGSHGEGSHGEGSHGEGSHGGEQPDSTKAAETSAKPTAEASAAPAKEKATTNANDKKREIKKSTNPKKK